MEKAQGMVQDNMSPRKKVDTFLWGLKICFIRVESYSYFCYNKSNVCQGTVEIRSVHGEMGDTNRMNTNSREKRNNYIYILKALAIFSVICAHSTPLVDGSSKWNVLSSQLLDYLGTFGVPIFFCISGYLFAGNRRNWGDFWKRKVTTLFLPWIC